MMTITNIINIIIKLSRLIIKFIMCKKAYLNSIKKIVLNITI